MRKTTQKLSSSTSITVISDDPSVGLFNKSYFLRGILPGGAARAHQLSGEVGARDQS